ncbi:helix-turn-helix domain-containing protein [Oceanobacillus alkalisoli]|uniref:helix-turn-helix domain-containing protein n=1 Tax=Oceanobacillus alkalisoli TaxID=2925113 RepID=UPI001EE42E08|nr:helix-turn-helix transcriptional regulator [Oceanobacillus alkalisoli]MCG5102574.1 helix-turn-helix domain-containing protein [Oceanobacillus alkalisoli]
MEVFKERLIDLRIEHGYKQEEVAKELNVTTSAYGYYEQGRNQPSLETLYNIARFFNVSTDYLLGKVDTPNHATTYLISEKLILNESELDVINRMKELNLLEELGKDPDKNVGRLHRYWEFIKDEFALDEN